MGRDIGLFGKDAILDDMTLLGVGTAFGNGNTAPGNTTLGRIGLGYIYTDWEPQITYTTPTILGFSASAGIFQPLDAISNATSISPGATYTSHHGPQLQIGASYAWGDPKSDALTGKVWVDLVSQEARETRAEAVANNDGISESDFTGTGADAGVKVDIAGPEAAPYGYYGKGIGTTGLYLNAMSTSGQKRESSGGYLQATYKIQKLKIGVSYGISELQLGDDERAFGVGTNRSASDLLRRNSSGVVGLYYSLTKSVTLVTEGIVSKAQAWNGNSAEEKDVALGGIPLFF